MLFGQVLSELALTGCALQRGVYLHNIIYYEDHRVER